MLGYLWRSAQFALLGLRQFTRDGYAANAKGFDDSIMKRDLKGYSCFVTGANQGIGYQASLELARRNATLYIVCRNKERGESAAQSIREATGNNDVHLKLCDVSSLESVRGLAASVEEERLPCHVLVNNAGVMVHTAGTKSVDNFEINFATNTLGTFALTSLFLPALHRAAASTVGTARVIVVSSGGMYTEGLEVEDLQMEKGTFKGEAQYAKDKRRQVALMERFAQLNRDSGILFASMHPGWTGTEGVKDALPGFSKQMEGKLRSLAEGADTIAWLALAGAEKIQPGGFYFDREPRAKHLFWAGTSYPPGRVDALWERLTEMAGLDERGAAAGAHCHPHQQSPSSSI